MGANAVRASGLWCLGRTVPDQIVKDVIALGATTFVGIFPALFFVFASVFTDGGSSGERAVSFPLIAGGLRAARRRLRGAAADMARRAVAERACPGHDCVVLLPRA